MDYYYIKMKQFNIILYWGPLLRESAIYLLILFIALSDTFRFYLGVLRKVTGLKYSLTVYWFIIDH